MSETKRKIRSLKALEAEKARLRASMNNSKEQALTSYTQARKNVPSYLLKKVALPASLTGIAALAFKRNKTDSTYQASSEAPKQGGFKAFLFSLFMSLVEDWASKRFDD